MMLNKMSFSVLFLCVITVADESYTLSCVDVSVFAGSDARVRPEVTCLQE